MLIIHEYGGIELWEPETTRENRLSNLQTAVRGLIEIVPVSDESLRRFFRPPSKGGADMDELARKYSKHKLIAIVDEEGSFGKPVNLVGSHLLQRTIFGPVALVIDGVEIT
jgi:hypothetical protein